MIQRPNGFKKPKYPISTGRRLTPVYPCEKAGLTHHHPFSFPLSRTCKGGIMTALRYAHRPPFPSRFPDPKKSIDRTRRSFRAGIHGGSASVEQATDRAPRIGGIGLDRLAAMQLQAYNRLGSSGSGGGGGGSPSPPASPRRSSPRLVRRPSKSSGGRPPPPPRSLMQRAAWMLLSLLLRRQGIFLFAPLIYVSGMLLYMGTVSLDSVPSIISRPAPGSVYRSPELYQRLRPAMDADNSSDGVSS